MTGLLLGLLILAQGLRSQPSEEEFRISRPNFRMFGGTEVSNEVAPFTAFLRTKISGGLLSICTGTILSEFWILTAAHCIVDIDGTWSVYPDPQSVTVKLGYSAGSKGKVFSQEVISERLISHSGFTESDKASYDVGLVKTGSKIEMASNRRRVTLGWSAPEVGTVCDDYGFGDTEFEDPRNGVLFTIKVKIVDCASYNNQNKNAVCFIGVKNGTSICSGDSGGPLICSGAEVAVNHATHSPKGQKECSKTNYNSAVKIEAVKNFIEEHTGITGGTGKPLVACSTVLRVHNVFALFNLAILVLLQ